MTEATKKGFADGSRGISGWSAVDSFNGWLNPILGIPQNMEQREARKKHKDRIWESYNKGLHEGWES